MKKINIGEKVIYSGYFFYSDLEVGVGIITENTNNLKNIPGNSLTVEYFINYKDNTNIKFIESNENMITRNLPDSLIHPYSPKSEKRIFTFIKNVSENVGKFPKNYDIQKELKKLFKYGKRNFYLWLTIYKIKTITVPIFEFVKNVILKGTFWLIFGSIISLYKSFYYKNKTIEQLSQLELINSMIQEGERKNKLKEEISKLEDKKETFDQNISNSTNFILALMLSVASLLISIISLRNK